MTADNSAALWAKRHKREFVEGVNFLEIDEFVRLEYNKDKLIEYIKGE